MNNIKSILLYILYLTLVFIILTISSLGNFNTVFKVFNFIFLPVNLLFSLFYILKSNNKSNVILIILSILAISSSFIFNDLIYNNILSRQVDLNNSLSQVSDSGIKKKIVEIEKRSSKLPAAEEYLNSGDYSSAWLYADLYIEKGGDDPRAEEIKDLAIKLIQNPDLKSSDKKYIDSIIFKSLMNQDRVLDAYYYCLENRDSIYDYDFLIKFRNSYLKLLEDYYSVDIVKSMESLPGYSDIRFYVINSNYELFAIEKLVEYRDYFFLYNVNYLGINYPYIVIDGSGKIFTSGFFENENRTILRDSLDLPVATEDLKLFSREFYPVIEKSLLYNLDIFSYKGIKYLDSQENFKLIIKTIINYLTLFAIFFIPLYYIDEKNILNYGFNSIVNVIITKWFIYNIGLILIETSLGLSIIFIIITYIFWINFVRKGIKLLPSQF